MYKCKIRCLSEEEVEIEENSTWDLIESNGSMTKLYSRGKTVTISWMKLILCFEGME